MEHIVVIAWTVVIIGILMRYYVAKKRFKRRAITGMQLFGSYEKAVAITVFERFLKLVGTLLILLGIIVLILIWCGHENEQEGAALKPLEEQQE